jgi:hypothetical protein
MAVSTDVSGFVITMRIWPWMVPHSIASKLAEGRERRGEASVAMRGCDTEGMRVFEAGPEDSSCETAS